MSLPFSIRWWVPTVTLNAFSDVFFSCILFSGEFLDSPFLAPFLFRNSPVLSFRSKTVRQPNRTGRDLTDSGGKCHKMKGIQVIDGELVQG
jgi:hypothetical protein